MTNPKPNALPVECWHLDWQGRRASGSWGGTYVWPPEWASTSSPSRSRTTCVCVWGGGQDHSAQGSPKCSSTGEAESGPSAIVGV